MKEVLQATGFALDKSIINHRIEFLLVMLIVFVLLGVGVHYLRQWVYQEDASEGNSEGDSE